jgi:hypothetical protein
MHGSMNIKHHLHVPIVLKYGSLNLLEPSEPVQASKGIALPFYPYLKAVFSLTSLRTFHTVAGILAIKL